MSAENTATSSAAPVRTLFYTATHSAAFGKPGRTQGFSVVLDRTAPTPPTEDDEQFYRHFCGPVAASFGASADTQQERLEAWRTRVATTLGYASTAFGPTRLNFPVRLVDASATRLSRSSVAPLSAADRQAYEASRTLDAQARSAWPTVPTHQTTAAELTQALEQSGLLE